VSFTDHFSSAAPQYAESRPTYPDALFAWLAEQSSSRALVWDAGCGSGQASVGLSAHFDDVVATDASAAQITHAEQRSNIRYSVAGETNSALAERSVDLITVAQALHWFDRGEFFAECERVLTVNGVLAVWTYDLVEITPDIDAVVRALYRDTLGAYWPPERQLVESRYRDIGFPYPLIDAPVFVMKSSWTGDRFLRYVESWSAVKEYRRREGRDPMPAARTALAAAWPDGVTHDVCWPLTLLAGRRQR
jgi:SAM-dependent methyltransferase